MELERFEMEGVARIPSVSCFERALVESLLGLASRKLEAMIISRLQEEEKKTPNVSNFTRQISIFLWCIYCKAMHVHANKTPHT